MNKLDWSAFIVQMLPYIGAAVLALIGWLTKEAAVWIRAHTKDTVLQTALLQLNDAIATAVRQTEQTTVASIKANAKNGKLDSEGAKQVRDEALAAAKANLGGRLDELGKSLGFTDPEKLEAFVVGRIEAQVQQMKK